MMFQTKDTLLSRFLSHSFTAPSHYLPYQTYKLYSNGIASFRISKNMSTIQEYVWKSVGLTAN